MYVRTVHVGPSFYLMDDMLYAELDGMLYAELDGMLSAETN